MFESLLCFLGCLKFHVGMALREVGLHPVHWHIDHFDLSVGGEDFLDVLLYDISGKSAQEDLSWFRTWASAASLPLLLLHRLRLGA